MKKQNIVNQNFQNRNSTSSVHVTTTMSFPDNLGIIHAVSIKVHEMILKGDILSKKSQLGPKKYSRSNESAKIERNAERYATLFSARSSARTLTHNSKNSQHVADENVENANPTNLAKTSAPPSVTYIFQFYRNIFETAQCSVDCTIVSLMYLERFLTFSGLNLNSKNWRSVTMISMLLASKVWDDLSMVNADFSVFLPYTLEQINSWERQFLSGLKYNVHVSASEYASRYFQMAGKPSGGSNVLNTAGAKRLDVMSKTMQSRIKDMHQDDGDARHEVNVRRAVSDQGVATHEAAKPRFVLD